MNNTITTNATITENTTLAELINILGPVTRAAKTPTSRKLREEAGEPIAWKGFCCSGDYRRIRAFRCCKTL